MDQYHGNKGVPKLYKLLSIFKPDSRKHIDPSAIMNEGYAEQNGLGTRSRDYNGDWDLEEWEDSLRIQNMVYISANGNVCTSCDLSFEHIDEEAFGNILTTDLLQMTEEKEAA